MKRLKAALVPIYQALATFAGRGTVEMDADGPNAIIFLAPDYGNVGDLAIGWAQEKYLQQLLPEYNVRSVPLSRTYAVARNIRRRLGPNDLIFLVGGGSTGDLYPRAQRGREFLARYFKRFRMISFPQSLIYSSGQARESSGVRESRSLAKHPRLTLCAREARSLADMRDNFSNRVIFAPDIVLSMVGEVRAMPNLARSGALLVLRGDAEVHRSAGDEKIIHDVISRRYEQVFERDNMVPDELVEAGSVYQPIRDEIARHRSVALVVTDRLHGMIFAAISGTPCVTISNTNHKISGTYESWIKAQCPYVEFLESVSVEALSAAVDRVTRPEALGDYQRVEFDFSEFDQEVLQAASGA